jgi:DNA mismatch repair protein MSH2
MSVMDSVLCRVGAGDHASRGISTFLSEMLEAKVALDRSTASSLVIIDELGRGTSTYDGFGLAWAVAQRLASRSTLTLFATHFVELCELSLTTSNVRNLHVSASVSSASGDLTMHYRVEAGVATGSFGVQIARRAGFPSSVVQEALEKAHSLETLSASASATAAAAAQSQADSEAFQASAQATDDAGDSYVNDELMSKVSAILSPHGDALMEALTTGNVTDGQREQLMRLLETAEQTVRDTM